MTSLISFTTTKFDASKETPNPINPIAGRGLLSWLRDELAKIGWKVTEPDTEDWGWYILVQKSGTSYLIGASGEFKDDTPSTDWIVQLHKQRSLFEKLTGRNRQTNDDLLAGEIERIIRRDASLTNVEIE